MSTDGGRDAQKQWCSPQCRWREAVAFECLVSLKRELRKSSGKLVEISKVRAGTTRKCPATRPESPFLGAGSEISGSWTATALEVAAAPREALTATSRRPAASCKSSDCGTGPEGGGRFIYRRREGGSCTPHHPIPSGYIHHLHLSHWTLFKSNWTPFEASFKTFHISASCSNAKRRSERLNNRVNKVVTWNNLFFKESLV